MRIRYLLALALGTVILLWWLSVFLSAYIRRRAGSKCPCCQSARLRPSWPKLRDKLLSYSALRPIRCESCQKRFYVLKSHIA
jgi:hypothetical protein